jgi:uncharacterized protein with FMN-binding domain
MATNQSPRSRPTVTAVPPRTVKKSKSGRLTGSLIGMSSAAIVSVYVAGYLNTQAVGNSAGALNSAAATADASAGGSAVVAPSMAQQTSGGTASSGNASSSAASGSQAAKPAAAASNSAYKDGTYMGTGSSRHGSIQATVVVRGGSIVSANVTGCGTRYPCSKVTSLVSQVVSRQSAPVNYVSGATDSSTAYVQAVKNALAQAASA